MKIHHKLFNNLLLEIARLAPDLLRSISPISKMLLTAGVIKHLPFSDWGRKWTQCFEASNAKAHETIEDYLKDLIQLAAEKKLINKFDDSYFESLIYTALVKTMFKEFKQRDDLLNCAKQLNDAVSLASVRKINWKQINKSPFLSRVKDDFNIISYLYKFNFYSPKEIIFKFFAPNTLTSEQKLERIQSISNNKMLQNIFGTVLYANNKYLLTNYNDDNNKHEYRIYELSPPFGYSPYTIDHYHNNLGSYGYKNSKGTITVLAAFSIDNIDQPIVIQKHSINLKFVTPSNIYINKLKHIENAQEITKVTFTKIADEVGIEFDRKLTPYANSDDIFWNKQRVVLREADLEEIQNDGMKMIVV